MTTARDLIALTLALAGPGVIALASQAFTRGRAGEIAAAAPWLGGFALLIAAVWALGVAGAGRSAQSVGLAWPPSLATLAIAAALTAFLILIYGPLVYAFLNWSGLGAFEHGQAGLNLLPKWYLALAIIIVAGGEEWLYRGFAIPVLEQLTGNIWLAGAISLLAFGLAHLPLWGFGVSLTTLVGGAIFTLLFIWRRDATSLMLAHVATDLYGLLLAPMLARSQ